jgi:hypothetical protein
LEFSVDDDDDDDDDDDLTFSGNSASVDAKDSLE